MITIRVFPPILMCRSVMRQVPKCSSVTVSVLRGDGRRRRASRYNARLESILRQLNAREVEEEKEEEEEDGNVRRDFARVKIRESRRSSASYSELVKFAAFYSLFFFVSLSRRDSSTSGAAGSLITVSRHEPHQSSLRARPPRRRRAEARKRGRARGKDK